MVENEHDSIAKNIKAPIVWTGKKDEKISNLMRSIDNTNHRYGRSTLSVASAGVHKKWNMRRQYSSKIDTADFYCLPTIRAWFIWLF